MNCAICGESLDEEDAAEMFDPARLEAPSVIVHAECGLAKGMEVA